MVRSERIVEHFAAASNAGRERGEHVIELQAVAERPPVAALLDARDDGVEIADGRLSRPEPGVQVAADDKRHGAGRVRAQKPRERGRLQRPVGTIVEMDAHHASVPRSVAQPR